VSDGVVKRNPHRLPGGAIERKRTMTGHNHLMSNAYVAAYQAEVEDGIQDAHMRDRWLRATWQNLAAWLVKTRASITATHRLRVASAQVRSFDRSSATGACEISDGLAV
jgi:hypothetical protein